jgi:hypothetical protein
LTASPRDFAPGSSLAQTPAGVADPVPHRSRAISACPAS